MRCPFCGVVELQAYALNARLRHCLRDCRSGPQLSPMCAVNVGLLRALVPRGCQHAFLPTESNVTTALRRLRTAPTACPLGCDGSVSPVTCYRHVLCDCRHGPRLSNGTFAGAFDRVEFAAVKYLAATNVDAGAGVAAAFRCECPDTKIVPLLCGEVIRRARNGASVEAADTNVAYGWVWEQAGCATPPENFHRCPLCAKWLLNREQMVFHAIRRCVLGPINLVELPSEQLLVEYIANLLAPDLSEQERFKSLATSARASATFDCPYCTAADNGDALSLLSIDAHVATFHEAALRPIAAPRPIIAPEGVPVYTKMPNGFELIVCPLCRCEPSPCEASDFQLSVNCWVTRHLWYDCPLGPQMSYLVRCSDSADSAEAVEAMLRSIVRFDVLTVDVVAAFEKSKRYRRATSSQHPSVTAVSSSPSEAPACPFCRRVMRDRSDNLYDRVSKCRKALLYRARGGCGQPRPLVERAPHPVAVERQRRVGRLSVIDAW